ncbi:MAG: SDR family oxidoreductase [Burkholderiaceae bacterium]
MSTALVIGASRGIGLEFVRQYVSEGWQVFGTHRTEGDRQMLRSAGAHTLRLDVNEPEDLAGIAWQLDGERIDVAIVNAGVYGPRDSAVGQNPDDESFDLVMRTNVLGAMRLLPVLAPMLIESAGSLVFVSSKMGSITETHHNFGALYRISKAAINMVARLAHAQYADQGVRVLSVHPGWVRTDMGGPNAEISVQTSVEGLRAVIADRGCAGGGFYDYRGSSLPW